MIRRVAGVLVLGVVASVAPGVGSAEMTCPISLPQGSEQVALDSDDFVERVDNASWPMAPSTRWVYREADTRGSEQRGVVKVKARTRDVAGISATVVRDIVREDGELVEDTRDWYAQDVCGNVWYLGENTKEYEDGEVVSTAGSWEHGVDGALAGVIVPADPQVGTTYRQEYYEGEAEDVGTVLSLDEQAQVPFGHFREVLLTKDFTLLERRVLEYKLYAIGIGPVLVLGVSGGADREELIHFETSAA